MATPKITWGASFANTWHFPGPVDNPRSLSPLEMSIVQAKAVAARDAWVTREDEAALFRVPFIPRVAIGSITGWTGSTGARAALRWLAKQNPGRFYADGAGDTYHTFVLIDFNELQHVNRSQGGSRYTVDMHIRDVNATAFDEY